MKVNQTGRDSPGRSPREIERPRRLVPKIPGLQAVIHDGALRGVQHQTFLRNLGVSTVSRVAAAQRIRDEKGTAVKRVDEVVYVETTTITTPAGRAKVQPFARGGQLGLGELTDTGDIAFLPLEWIRIHRARSKAGTYRWYSDRRLPDEHGGGTITVRLHGNAEDAKRKFGRTEKLRPIPADDPDFDRLYARGNDAEHQPPPRRHLVARPSQQHRPPPPRTQPPHVRAVRQRAGAAPPPTSTRTRRGLRPLPNRTPAVHRACRHVRLAEVVEFSPESASAPGRSTATPPSRSSGRECSGVFSHVLCRSRPDSTGWFMRPKRVRGVTAVWPNALADRVTVPGEHTDRVDAIAQRLRDELPPAT